MEERDSAEQIKFNILIKYHTGIELSCSPFEEYLLSYINEKKNRNHGT